MAEWKNGHLGGFEEGSIGAKGSCRLSVEAEDEDEDGAKVDNDVTDCGSYLGGQV